MSNDLLFSIVESPTHPDFSALYRELGLNQLHLNSQRKAIQALKKTPPDWVVAEFFYGYGNNYAGVNLGNLDVFLHSLRKYAPHARVIVLCAANERQHAERLASMFPVHALLSHPIAVAALRAALMSSA